jgi:hypothetical protein
VLLATSGAVGFQGSRFASNRVTGSFDFGAGKTLAFDGAVVDSSRINGSIARIEGSLVAVEGTTCPFVLYHALVP